MNDLLEAAVRYAELGYAVFPCVPGDSNPLTAHGFHDASLDPDRIERWWTEHPHANIGLPTAGLVVVDIDGESNPWPGPERALELAAGPMATTPGGGGHRIFRQPAGKAWRCTQSDLAPRVDTRADGGYVVVPPSRRPDGEYRWVPGSELDVPPERLPEPPAWLVAALDGLAARRQTAHGGPTAAHLATSGAGGNAIPTGQRNATLARLAGTMRRVGMSGPEILAALDRANADRCNPPLDHREVARIAASVARYAPDEVAVALAENHWDQMYAAEAQGDEAEPLGRDPGPIPGELLRVPGFVSELMDHCLATAPYPNVPLAFGGALALQAFLAGRKVRDPGDNRTNLFLLGLAHSSAGKDWPRKLNTEIAHRIKLANSLGERFASGEGIQDALFISPSMLFQTDEIDGLLQSMNLSRDGRHESIMGTLLTMYSSANSVYPMRRKAGKESPGSIDQPCLCIFGTAIPNHYYAALSERMLTNGLFARMIILESTRRGSGQEPGLRDVPERILETAAWWADYNPGSGNLLAWHPAPAVVEHTAEARAVLVAAREEAEAEYASAESRNDSVGTTVWGRVSEQSRKLALVHAASADHREPRIDRAAAEWAVRLVMHQTRRMLFMARRHVSETPFHAECLKLIRKLKEAGGRMARNKLMRAMRCKMADFDQIVGTLLTQGDIETVDILTRTKPALGYKVIDT